MSKRPDFIHCIGKGYQDGRPPEPWCGDKSHEIEPFFVDATHASLNGLHGGRLVACQECVKEINKALRNGHEEI